MKKRVMSTITLLLFLMLLATDVRAEEPQLYKCRATAYVLKGKTATNTEVRTGICASGRKEWLGCTILVYQRLEGDKVGRLLYVLQCEDTGCKENVIDIWADGMDNAQAVMDTVYEDGCQGRIYVQVIDANG